VDGKLNFAAGWCRPFGNQLSLDAPSLGARWRKEKQQKEKKKSPHDPRG